MVKINRYIKPLVIGKKKLLEKLKKEVIGKIGNCRMRISRWIVYRLNKGAISLIVKPTTIDIQIFTAERIIYDP